METTKKHKIGIVCYPTYGGSGVVATELGISLAEKGHEVHFISYSQPFRLDVFCENTFFHEVAVPDYPLFDYAPYELNMLFLMPLQQSKQNIFWKLMGYKFR